MAICGRMRGMKRIFPIIALLAILCGTARAADFTIDSIQLFGGNVDAVVYLDDIMHNALGMIPEPGSAAVLGLAGLALLRRRRV